MVRQKQKPKAHQKKPPKYRSEIPCEIPSPLPIEEARQAPSTSPVNRLYLRKEDLAAMMPRLEKYFSAILDSPLIPGPPPGSVHYFYPEGCGNPIPVKIIASLTEEDAREHLRQAGLVVEPRTGMLDIPEAIPVPPFHEQLLRFIKERQAATVARRFGEAEIDRALFEAWLILLQNVQGNVARQFIGVEPSRKIRLEAERSGWLKFSAYSMAVTTYELAHRVKLSERPGIRRMLVGVDADALEGRIKRASRGGRLRSYDHSRHLPLLQRLDLKRFRTSGELEPEDQLRTEIIHLGLRG